MSLASMVFVGNGHGERPTPAPQLEDRATARDHANEKMSWPNPSSHFYLYTSGATLSNLSILRHLSYNLRPIGRLPMLS